MNQLLEILSQTLPPNLYFLTEEIEMESLYQRCEDFGFSCYYINGENIKSKLDFLASCAEAMNFPDYFGMNWDSFEDCLTDLYLRDNKPHLLFFHHSEKLAQNAPQAWDALLEILDSAITFLQEHDILFYVILQHSTREN